MSEPVAHHYVPRFYLRRFASADERLWVFDKATKRVFRNVVGNLSVVNRFYDLPELEAQGLDRFLLERQLGQVEGRAASILRAWDPQFASGAKIEVAKEEKDAFSLFVVVQMLRTVEARTQILQWLRLIGKLASDAPYAPPPPEVPESEDGQASLHAAMMWDDQHVASLVERFSSYIWMFGLNESGTTFLTSDNPALIKDGENRGFVVNPVHDRLLDQLRYDPRDYLVFPLSPKVILYGYDRSSYPKYAIAENMVTPVTFDEGMANHENSGQVGMSHRFIYSSDGNFAFVHDFIRDQPWVCERGRDRFEAHADPYATRRGGPIRDGGS